VTGTRRAPAAQIGELAHSLGFDLVGIAPAAAASTHSRYLAWLAEGYHGEMAYLAREDAVARRADPARSLPGVRTVIVAAANYATLPLPADLARDPARGILARYAWGDDYHEWFQPRLQQLVALVEAATGGPVAHRAYVDTGPLLERELAARCGLGFIGKNTNLIHPRLGSWLLLGELLLGLELEPGVSAESGPAPAEPGTCGGCRRCLDACPTGALVAPYLLDARRCLSYLTIELKGAIPGELRPALGNRIFGCDRCQEVCPWNRRFARPSREAAFQPRPGAIAPRLLDLITLDEEGFARRFGGSPVMRARRRGLLRNVAVALGNWGDPAALPGLRSALHDPEPLVRGHAAWALGRIPGGEARQSLALALCTEAEGSVQAELRAALG